MLWLPQTHFQNYEGGRGVCTPYRLSTTPPKLLKITETKIKLCKYRHYFNIHHNFQKGKSGHISILTDEAFCQQVKQQIKGFLREFLLQFNH